MRLATHTSLNVNLSKRGLLLRDHLKSDWYPVDMFTVIFALGRTVGWISHWLEMHASPYKIAAHASFIQVKNNVTSNVNFKALQCEEAAKWQLFYCFLKLIF